MPRRAETVDRFLLPDDPLATLVDGLDGGFIEVQWEGMENLLPEADSIVTVIVGDSQGNVVEQRLRANDLSNALFAARLQRWEKK